jgi:NADH-quinone oxidoreductase subunit M
MGTYGFMKLGFPLFPDAARVFTPVLMTLSVVSIVYGACLALVQHDIKKIIAYSSISHLGYVMLGLLSLDLAGIQGAVVQMVSHGLVAAGLFLLVGMVYERGHTRELSAYGGLARQMPVFSVFFIVSSRWRRWGCPPPADSPANSSCCSVPSPPPGRSISWQQSPARSLRHGVTGVVLGALYMLRFALTFVFGPVKAPHGPLAELTLRERTVLGAHVFRSSRSASSPTVRWRKTELAAKRVSATRVHLPPAIRCPGAP